MKHVFNAGIEKQKDLVVFYSKRRTAIPIFTLPIRDEFVQEDSCYLARYRRCEGSHLLRFLFELLFRSPELIITVKFFYSEHV